MVVPGSVAIVAVATARSDRPDATARSVGLAATAMPTDGYRSWLLDTGCRYDLTTRSSVPEHLQGMILPAPVKITLATANDLAYGTQIVRQQIGEFGEVAEPYILDCSPDVLSIGRRCVEDGYRFVWEPYSLHPTMTTAAGKVVTLASRDCCPYLDDYEPSYSNPAASAVCTPNDKVVTWDPDGPLYDEPPPQGGVSKPHPNERVRPQGRHPLSDDADSDDSCWNDDIFLCPSDAPTVQANDGHRKVGSEPLTAAVASSWTVVGKPNPPPIEYARYC